MKRFTRYLNTFARVNGLANEQDTQWLFHCGMLFLSADKWWGDFKFRSSIHEGIDITYYKTSPAVIQHFEASVKVPAFANGTLLNICDDFLGQTLVVGYKPTLNTSHRVILIYAHVLPDNTLAVGDMIQKDSIIARVCDTKKNPQLPPHLHFSCFEVPEQIPDSNLDWNLFSKPDEIQMIHPVFL